jgi:hypothetical protein
MWRSEKQRVEAIRLLLANLFSRERTQAFWQEDGPTELALEYAKASPLSSGEQVLLRVALDFWNGQGGASFADVIYRLDSERLRTVVSLALAIDRETVNEWIRDELLALPFDLARP